MLELLIEIEFSTQTKATTLLACHRQQPSMFAREKALSYISFRLKCSLNFIKSGIFSKTRGKTIQIKLTTRNMKFMPNYIIYIVCSKKRSLTMDYCNGKHFAVWHGKSRSFLFFYFINFNNHSQKISISVCACDELSFGLSLITFGQIFHEIFKN